MFISREGGNPAFAGIALPLRESRYDMTCPKDNTWVYEAKRLLIGYRHETNATQSVCLPCVTLHGFVPSDKKKLYSAGFVHVPYANNVNVVYPKDFGITVVAISVIIIAIMIMLEEHDIAMRCPRIYDILSPSNIICGVVEFCEVVMINSVTLEEN